MSGINPGAASAALAALRPYLKIYSLSCQIILDSKKAAVVVM